MTCPVGRTASLFPLGSPGFHLGGFFVPFPIGVLHSRNCVPRSFPCMLFLSVSPHFSVNITIMNFWNSYSHLILEESVLSGSDSSALPQHMETVSGLAASQKVPPVQCFLKIQFLGEFFSLVIFALPAMGGLCVCESVCVLCVHVHVGLCMCVCRYAWANVHCIWRAEVNDRYLL